MFEKLIKLKESKTEKGLDVNWDNEYLGRQVELLESLKDRLASLEGRTDVGERYKASLRAEIFSTEKSVATRKAMIERALQ